MAEESEGQVAAGHSESSSSEASKFVEHANALGFLTGTRVAIRLVGAGRKGLYALCGMLVTMLLGVFGTDLVRSQSVVTVGEYVTMLISAALTGLSGVLFHLAEDLLREELIDQDSLVEKLNTLDEPNE